MRLWKYNLMEKIESGAYGEIFYTESKNRIVKVSNDFETIQNEINTYKYLRKLQGNLLPILYDYGNNFIIIEKLNKYKRIYDIRNIILSLGKFSEMNIVHGDIKQENIMTRNFSDIVFIDWGLSYNIYNKNAVPLGTPIYMGIFSHEGKLSFRNDLESLLYNILHDIHPLYWEKLCFDFLKTRNIEIYKEIYNMKKLFREKLLMRDSVFMNDFQLDKLENLYKFSREVLSLHRTEKPDYYTLSMYFPSSI
jgi:serine/threonine protein kinase